jgi:hypothetical protein
MPTKINQPLQTDAEWIDYIHKAAHTVIIDADYPYTDRELRILYQSKLAGIKPVAALRIATLDQLKEWNREVSK